MGCDEHNNTDISIRGQIQNSIPNKQENTKDNSMNLSAIFSLSKLKRSLFLSNTKRNNFIPPPYRKCYSEGIQVKDVFDRSLYKTKVICQHQYLVYVLTAYDCLKCLELCFVFGFISALKNVDTATKKSPLSTGMIRIFKHAG